MKVVVVEQTDGAGSYAHSFRRGPYTFYPAIHVTLQGRDGLLLDVLYRHLGNRDRIDLVRLKEAYDVVFRGTTIRVPHTLEEFAAAHAEDAEEEPFFAELLRLCMQVQSEAHQLPSHLSLDNLDAAAQAYPMFFRYRTSTIAEVMDERTDTPRLKASAGACWPYLGLPPLRAAFLTFAQLMTLQMDGAYVCRGAFQTVADALVYSLEQNGGELLLRQRVTNIVDEGRTTGVTLADNRRLHAPLVISNADALTTVGDLVGSEHLSANFLRRLRRSEPSLSAFVVFAATSLDLSGSAHESFLYTHWDHEETYRDVLSGVPGRMWGTVPTAIDPFHAPPGEHIVLTSLASFDIGRPWAQEKDRFEQQVLEDFDVVFPGPKDNLTFLESATPMALRRFALNQGGVCCGWANTPGQTASKRTDRMTPVGGLYLAGHWTHRGRVPPVSGVHTAMAVLSRPASPFRTCAPRTSWYRSRTRRPRTIRHGGVPSLKPQTGS